MLHNGSVLDRRRFLLAGASLSGIPRSRASTAVNPPGLRLEYAVSNPPAVPPPLRLESPARLVLEFCRIGEAERCTLSLRVVRASERCLLPLALWTADLAYYRRAREALHLPAYTGSVAWSEDRWSLAVAGREAFAVRVVGTAREPGAAGAPLPWVTYRYTLAADWRTGPLDKSPPELWTLRSATGSSIQRLAADSVATTGDPGGLFSRFGVSDLVSATVLGRLEEPESAFTQAVPAEDLEPFALRNYPNDSLGSPPLDTIFLQPDALERYRSRQEVRLSGVMLASVDAAVDRAAVAPLLPPPCRARDTAVVRVAGVRGLDDPELDEAWLLAECDLDGRRVWYALSHVRGSIGGSEFGREALGYPTIPGTVAATLGGNRFGVSVSREQTQLYDGGGFYGGFSTGTSLADMHVATLRLRHQPRQLRPTGEIVVQAWSYQGLRKPVSRESLHASFAAGSSGPWSRVGPARAYWAVVFDSATLQRTPPAVVAEVDDVGPYFRDRCEGRIPWEAPGRDRVAD